MNQRERVTVRPSKSVGIWVTSLVLLLTLTNYVQAQDTLKLKSGVVIYGKLSIVKSETVEFVEGGTSIKYELKKSEVESISLPGKTLFFEHVGGGKRDAALILVAITGAILIGYILIRTSHSP